MLTIQSGYILLTNKILILKLLIYFEVLEIICKFEH